jgi:hypothetical protein
VVCRCFESNSVPPRYTIYPKSFWSTSFQSHCSTWCRRVYDVPTLRCTRAKPLVLKTCRSGSLLLAHQTDYRVCIHVHAHELPTQTYIVRLVVIDRGTRNCITSSRGSNSPICPFPSPFIHPAMHQPLSQTMVRPPLHNNPYSSPTTPHQYLRNGSHRHPPIAHP